MKTSPSSGLYKFVSSTKENTDNVKQRWRSTRREERERATPTFKCLTILYDVCNGRASVIASIIVR